MDTRMKKTSRPVVLQAVLCSAFPSRQEAAAFARFVTKTTGGPATTRPFVLEGDPADSERAKDCAATWTQVMVPARLEGRAIELQAAWRAGREWIDDCRYAAHIEQRDLMDAAELGAYREATFEAVGLSAEQSRFLDAARMGTASGWNFGSSAVALMKRAGYVEAIRSEGRTVYTLTEAGARILSANPCPSCGVF